MDALKILTELKLNHLKVKHPTVPVRALPKVQYSGRTSNNLTRCIIDFLNLSGHQAERISNTGRRIDRTKVVEDVLGNRKRIGSTQWVTGTGTNGTADISATIAGRSVKIEVKIGRDKQSEAQKKYQERIEAADGIYLIARSFQQFYDWYCENFKN